MPYPPRMPKCRFFRRVMAVSLLCWCTVSSAGDDATPRLWEAVRGGEHAAHLYVLGATHWGLPIEYDDYFTRTVLPAFDQATVLHFEGAGNREPEPFPTCDLGVFDSEERHIVEQLREVALALQLKVFEEMHRRSLAVGLDDGLSELVRNSMARFDSGNFDDFGIMQNYDFNLIILNSFANASAAPQPATDTTTPTTLRGPIVDQLRAYRPAIAVRDLDSRYGVRRAYCAAGRERIKMLQSTFAQQRSDTPAVTQQVPRWTADFIKVLHHQPLLPDSSMMRLAPMNQQIVCQRTAEWLAEVEAYPPGGIHFVVVGAQHLHSLATENAHCAGLLDGLARAGFTVRPVDSVLSVQK